MTLKQDLINQRTVHNSISLELSARVPVHIQSASSMLEADWM